MTSNTEINITENNKEEFENETKSKEKSDDGKKTETGEEEEKGPSNPPPVGLIELFKFSTPLDTFLIIFGLTLAFSCGSAIPILCILFGDTLQTFVDDATIKALNQTLEAGGLTLNATNLPEPMMVVIGRFGW